MFTLKNITKYYGATKAVSNVNLSLPKGQCIALLGVNGAGKTTTLRMLAGLIHPSEGNITFDEDKSKTDYRDIIGYLPQYPQFHNWMTGEEYIKLAAKLSNVEKDQINMRAEELLKQTGIYDARKKRISTYSGGMKQRLGIAQALIHRPKLLLLDEPVSSLDPIGRRDVLRIIDRIKADTTILFSTHILSDAEEISDYLVVMDRGQIVEKGTLHELTDKYQKQQLELQVKASSGLKEQLVALKDVTSVTEVQNKFVIEVNHLESAKNEILILLTSHDYSLQSFSVRKSTLEEMFMEVIQDANL